MQENNREVRQKCFRALQAIVYFARQAGEGLDVFLCRSQAMLRASLHDFQPKVAQCITSYYVDRMGKCLKHTIWWCDRSANLHGTVGSQMVARASCSFNLRDSD